MQTFKFFLLYLELSLLVQVNYKNVLYFSDTFSKFISAYILRFPYYLLDVRAAVNNTKTKIKKSVEAHE